MYVFSATPLDGVPTTYPYVGIFVPLLIVTELLPALNEDSPLVIVQSVVDELALSSR